MAVFDVTLKWDVRVIRASTRCSMWSVTARAPGVFAAPNGEQLIVLNARSGEVAICRDYAVRYVRVPRRDRVLAFVTQGGIGHILCANSVTVIDLDTGVALKDVKLEDFYHIAPAGTRFVVVEVQKGHRKLLELARTRLIANVPTADTYHWISGVGKICAITWTEYDCVEILLFSPFHSERTRPIVVYTGELPLPGYQFYDGALRIECANAKRYSVPVIRRAWPCLSTLLSHFARVRDKEFSERKWEPVGGLPCSLAVGPSSDEVVLSSVDRQELDRGELNGSVRVNSRPYDVINSPLVLRSRIPRIFVSSHGDDDR